MLRSVGEPGFRVRVLMTRLLARLGLGESSFLLVLAVVIGFVSAAAAVGFHELIYAIRDLLYWREGAEFLYGKGVWLLILIPAAGGLTVGALSRYVFRTREGHGVTDVIESVIRTSGFQQPWIAIEKIFTSAVTIGTGGSAGAEGPIVQIGAAIAAGVGQMFRMARHHMPILIGCGSAAGISSIFNAPFGGVLFTLEVILQDFSLRTITPVVLASVVAQVTTMSLFHLLRRVSHGAGEYKAIFGMPYWAVEQQTMLSLGQFANFVALGLLCGVVGVALTRIMQSCDSGFRRLRTWPAVRPAIGGALLGVIGVLYIILFGRVMLGQAKPFPFSVYPMPAFFGDGYGIVQRLLSHDFYTLNSTRQVLLLLVFLCAAKVIGTSLTLGSGGSGGIIAPSIFLGATAGAMLGILLRITPYFSELQPELYALVAMGAVLAAVVHAPMASILIVFELTQDYKVMLPAMLACITATGMARLLYRDSIYTATLRRRGLRIGGRSDLQALRQTSIEQVSLEPATVIQASDPLQRVLELMSQMGTSNFVVIDKEGRYLGMLVSEDINVALMQREAIPLMIVSELMRTDLPRLNSTDDLAAAMDAFARYDVSQLPVVLAAAPDKVIGMISRAGLLRRYQLTVG
jgi:CIC family chloride channel protein